MKRWLWLALIVLAVVLLPGGAIVAVVVVKSRSDFLRLIAAEVARQLEELRPDLSQETRQQVGRIVAAQAALESGYGSTKAFKEGWNFGNISKGAWTGPVIAGGDLEYDAAGNVKGIQQLWRKYDSLAAAVSDFLTLLSWSRYRPARDRLFALDADGYAEQLRAGGYFTAPLAEYQRAIRGALAEAERVA